MKAHPLLMTKAEPTLPTLTLREEISTDGRVRVVLERRWHRGSIITTPGTVFYVVRRFLDGQETDFWVRDWLWSAERLFRREVDR